MQWCLDVEVNTSNLFFIQVCWLSRTHSGKNVPAGQEGLLQVVLVQCISPCIIEAWQAVLGGVAFVVGCFTSMGTRDAPILNIANRTRLMGPNGCDEN